MPSANILETWYDYWPKLIIKNVISYSELLQKDGLEGVSSYISSY